MTEFLPLRTIFSPNKGLKINIGVLISAFIAQGILWTNINFLDSGAWAEGAAIIASGSLPDPSHMIYGYPGTLFLLPSALLIHFGVENLLSTKIVMVAILSLGIACTTFFCYLLRKRYLWWFYAGVILSVNPFFARSTPPTALITILACIIAVYTLYIFENESKPSYYSFVGFGILGGFLLISRHDIGFIIFVSSIFFLWHYNHRRILLSVSVAMLIYYIGNPFLWSNPLHYFNTVFLKIYDHGVLNKISVASSIFHFFNLSVFLGAISFIIGLAFLTLRPDTTHIPRPYLIGLISVTVISTGALAISQHHPVWLFFPFSFMWELFLPLFILNLSEESHLRGNQASLLLTSIILGHFAISGIIIATY